MQKNHKYFILLIAVLLSINIASALNINIPTSGQKINTTTNFTWTNDTTITGTYSGQNSDITYSSSCDSLTESNGAFSFNATSNITVYGFKFKSFFTSNTALNVSINGVLNQTIGATSYTQGQFFYVTFTPITLPAGSYLTVSAVSFRGIFCAINNRNYGTSDYIQKASLSNSLFNFTLLKNVTDTQTFINFTGSDYLYTNNGTINSTDLGNITSPFLFKPYNYGLRAGNNYTLTVGEVTRAGTLYNTTSTIFNLTRDSLLNITAYFNSAIVNTFTASIKDVTANTVTNYSTTNGFIYVDVVKGQSYNVTIDATNASLSNNYTTIGSVSSTLMNFTLQTNNSIQFTIVDEISSAIIAQPMTITISTDTSLQNYTTSTGYLNVSGVTLGINTITFTSTNYSTRTYIINMIDRSTQTLTARLLNNTNSIAVGVYTKTQTVQVLPNTLITVQRQYIGGSFATILQSITDDTGFATFNVQSGTTYRVILSATDYNTKQFNQQFFTANSPYTWVLTQTGTSVYTNVLDGVQYYYSPTNTTIINGLNTFSITTYNATFTVAWTAVNANGTITNVSGSPTGGTASTIVDLTGFNGVYPIIYMFNYLDPNTNTYQTYSIPINYYTTTQTAYNTTLPQTLTDLNTQIDNPAWTAVLAVFLIFATVMTVMQLSHNVTAGVVSGFAAMIVFAFIGWISGLIVAVIVITSIILLYTERNY